jgi:hypothetical protein
MVSGSTAAPTIQFQQVNSGIVLTVTGFVEDDGTLNLHLQPEVSDAAAPVGGSPTTTVRKADTYVRIKPGEAIALGGLTRVTETNQSSKVPILGDIPLVGSLFRSNQKVKQKTEVVILIVPRLAPGFTRRKPVEPESEPVRSSAAASESQPITEPSKAASTKLMSLGIPSKGAKEPAAAPAPTAPLDAPSISKILVIGSESQTVNAPMKAEELEGTADVSLVTHPGKKGRLPSKRPTNRVGRPRPRV